MVGNGPCAGSVGLKETWRTEVLFIIEWMVCSSYLATPRVRVLVILFRVLCLRHLVVKGKGVSTTLTEPMNFIACFLWVGKHVGVQAMFTLSSLERLATVQQLVG